MTAPLVPRAPQTSLAELSLDPFEFTGVPQIIWDVIQVEEPTPPELNFPTAPPKTDPPAPTAPAINLKDPPDVVLQDLQVAMACPTRESFVVPADITFRQWTTKIPSFNSSAPDPDVCWKEDVFVSALATSLTEKYKNFVLSKDYRGRSLNRNGRIWADVDSVGIRGNLNSYGSRRADKLAKGKRSIRTEHQILTDQNNLALDKIRLTKQQQHESVLRLFHDQKQKLKFALFQSTLNNAVANYNACIKGFNAQIAAYKMEAAEFLGEIERKRIKLQEYADRVQIAESTLSYNAEFLGYSLRMAAVNNALIDLFKAQTDLNRAKLNINLLKSQIERLEIEAFAALTNVEVSKVRRDLIEADVEVEKTKEARIDTLKKTLQAQIKVAEVELESAQEVFAARKEAFNALQSAQSQVHDSFRDFSGSEEGLANARLRLAEVNKVLGRATSVLGVGELNATTFREVFSDLNTLRRERRDNITDESIQDKEVFVSQTQTDARTQVAETELEVQRLLAKADVTSHLVHEISTA